MFEHPNVPKLVLRRIEPSGRLVEDVDWTIFGPGAGEEFFDKAQDLRQDFVHELLTEATAQKLRNSLARIILDLMDEYGQVFGFRRVAVSIDEQSNTLKTHGIVVDAKYARLWRKG